MSHRNRLSERTNHEKRTFSPTPTLSDSHWLQSDRSITPNRTDPLENDRD